MVKSMFDGQGDDEVEGHGIATNRIATAVGEAEGRRSASIEEEDDTQGHVRSMLVDEDDDTAGHVVRH